MKCHMKSKDVMLNIHDLYIFIITITRTDYFQVVSFFSNFSFVSKLVAIFGFRFSVSYTSLPSKHLYFVLVSVLFTATENMSFVKA